MTRTCMHCGTNGQETKLVPVYDYPWDGSDTEGSIQELVGYRCEDRGACRQRQRELAQIHRPDDTYSRGTGQGWGHQQ